MSRVGSVVTIGEAMALFIAEGVGPLSQAATAQIRTGGAEANVAIGLSRLNVPVSWLGRHGNDQFGRRVARELRAEGVDVHAIVDSTAPTGLMVREQRISSRARVWYYRADSAGSRLQPGDLSPDFIENAALLHLTGITPALSSTARYTVHCAIERAKSASVPISFDVNHRSRLWGDEEAARVLTSLASTANIVFAGIDEAQLITGSSSEDPEVLARAIAERGASEVVIKLGPQGALTLSDQKIWRMNAAPAAVVDTVGAGDAFVAGYLSQWMAEADIAERLKRAVTTASIVCESEGDWEGAPTIHELELLAAGDAVVR